MAEASKVTFHLHSSSIPYIPESLEYAELGMIPAWAYANRKFQEGKVDVSRISTAFQYLLFDPQSSGGLLYSIPMEEKERALEAFEKADLDTTVSCIGEVRELEEKNIILY